MKRILTINGGSSTIKFALFEASNPPKKLFTEKLEGSDGAIEKILARVDSVELSAVGHRIVHGGPNLIEPTRVTPQVLDELRKLVPIDPDHLPGEIALIEAMHQHAPNVSQVLCFDTAFHATLPRVATLLPIPRRYNAAGIRRYGFHGLSFTYLMNELKKLDPKAAEGKLILAHLGAGASLAAISNGNCVDTTMSFTPTAGLVMATRTGDLDPGVLVHLLRTENLTADAMNDLVNRQSGLLGISETTGDMRKLLAARKTDVRSAEAVEIFCHAARKQIAAMAAALDGVQTLIFSGGIGENAAEVRSEICRGLNFLGIRLDESANAANCAVISAAGSACTVRVIATDEEQVIADQTRSLLKF
jgi:acetate kinase